MKLIAKTACAAASLAVAFLLCSNAAPLSAKVSVVQSGSPALMPGAAYSWSGGNEASVAGVDPAIANPIAGQRLRAAIELSLASKGFRRVDDPSAAHLMVSYHVSLSPEKEAKVSVRGGPLCGFRGCIVGGRDVDVTQSSYTAGLLVLDIVDPRTGQLVWRATSDKRVDAKDVTQEKLNALLKSMTKTLPSI